jgi:hypothetical protein
MDRAKTSLALFKFVVLHSLWFLKRFLVENSDMLCRKGKIVIQKHRGQVWWLDSLPSSYLA